MRPGLTVRQAEVLSAIRSFIAEQGIPPTLADLSSVIGTTKGGAGDVIRVLERKGCLVRPKRVARGLQLVSPAAGLGGVHLASAVVAYQQGEPVGVAYRVTAVETGSVS